MAKNKASSGDKWKTVLGEWRKKQEDRGMIKTAKEQEKESNESCSTAVLALLQLDCPL